MSSELRSVFQDQLLTKVEKVLTKMMQVSVGSVHSHEKQPFQGIAPANEAKKPKPVEKSAKTTVFVNHAANAWHESRKQWIGDLSQRPKRIEKDPIISWSTTYEDLLSTNEPFAEPISLTEMVDFLVDIWHDEGLYD
ncbi:hypothetical protein M9H77_34590 [Catharanthus roseus]|uniref:Uncharacterized protein n=1 Tax=Catharanthus roseus TaxID=4058 RepID=A0ACB9ZMC5_CATRO|nr:hypothetical protein M9H77_34590 [Catharanthus roseus]